MTSYEERMERLAFLREQFPSWFFLWQVGQPQWHAQRRLIDYASVPAAITGVSASDPNEVALLLQRVQAEGAEAGSVAERAATRLVALRECLASRGFEVALDETGLTVIAPVDDRGFRLTVTVVCKPRPSDGDHPWSWTVEGEPIAEADRIVDAAVFVIGKLRVRP